MASFSVFRNPQAANRSAYPFRDLLSVAEAMRVHTQIVRCPVYARTPLVSLADVAGRADVGRVFYKDESSRFGIGSFKALGGAYAVARVLIADLAGKTGREVSIADLARGTYAQLTRQTTVTCATDGNHGRAVAAGARAFGCRCVVFLHAGVSDGRENAIASFGAEIVRVPGNYDDSVRAAHRAAEERQWKLVADTSWDGYERTPADVMQGYAVMLIEVLNELNERGEPLPTHVFVQGGVGGLAAAVVAHLWEALGPQAMPTFVLVEPDRAACLYASAMAGKPTPVYGALDTVMAGLACGEVSQIAWRILAPAVEFFMTIPDEFAIAGMRLLAAGGANDPPLIAGESATAGLAGLLSVACETDDRWRKSMRLDRNARVLLFGTEGATDPQLYERLIGTPRAHARRAERA